MKHDKLWTASEILIIVSFAIFPLLLTFPYRAYIYLSWEGAYRLSEGQLPFRDFGLPLGGMFWVIPALFFKLFGPQIITLIKAQAFINVLSGFSFLSILKTLSVNRTIRIAGILVYCLSFSFQNFWPWYNHTVIVYGFIAIAFVLKHIFEEKSNYRWVFLLIGSLFTFFSFFTKQDGGGLIFILCAFLLIYSCWLERNWLPFATYVITSFLFVGIAVFILSSYNFGYWFNYGQSPHNARISFEDILDNFLGGSQWLKFYLFIIVLLALIKIRNHGFSEVIRDKKYILFLLLTLGILCMAAIIAVTSYIPTIGNFFFHSFAFVFIFHQLFSCWVIDVNKRIWVLLLFAGITMWWSHLPWNYSRRMWMGEQQQEGVIALSLDNENLVGLHNFILKEKHEQASNVKWVSSNLYTLKNMKLPQTTLEGIKRIMDLDIVKEGESLNVLNMSELTFLAAELPYSLESNPNAPLWHHLGVGMFNKQLHMYEDRIRDNQYDLVLFEYIPELNNFYPFAVRDVLMHDYKRIDSFEAPRSSPRPGVIEVYVRK